MFEVGVRKNNTSFESLRNKLIALIDLSQVHIEASVDKPDHSGAETLLIRFQVEESELPGILKKMLDNDIELCHLSYNEPNGADSLANTPSVDMQNDNYLKVFEKAIQEVSTLQHELLEALLKAPSPIRKINLPSMNGFRRFDVSTVIRCESEDNYTHIFFTNHKKITVSRTLQEFEQKLSDAGFFRVHHKHLINTEHIVEYRKGKGGQVIMSDQSTIDVSARKKSHFIRYINDLSKLSDTY